MSTSASVQTRARTKSALVRAALILPLIIVLACILGPVIYSISLTARRSHQTNPPTGSTTEPPTYTFSPPTTTAPGSCHNTSDCPAGKICVIGICINATTTSSSSTHASTTVPTTTRTTSTSATTSVTTSTRPSTAAPTTTTTTLTTTTTTSGPFATCQACSLNAVLGSCASEYAACQANTYNCPVLCYGTFQLNGHLPATCTNGLIPQWPPLRDCICRTANITCGGECTGCAYTTGTTVTETTAAPPACQACFDAAVSGPCSSQASNCYANPTGSCALVCAPYYRANLYVFSGCDSVTYWPDLASCLCPRCSNNATCTANQC
jgi:hypothetical protein